MAYRFKLTEPFGSGLRRIVLQQIDRAITQSQAGADTVDGSITSVHEIRKCLKRARAALRLGRPMLGDGKFKAWNAALRDTGRRLASQRDRDVMAQLVLSLGAESALKPTAVVRLQKAIAAMPGSDGDTPQALTETMQELHRLREDVDSTDLEQLAPDLAGLAVSYQACRDAFQTAFDSAAEEALHDWRKTVQLHWRHMQLLQAGWPAFFDARIEEARALSAEIGAHRDLGLLRAMTQHEQFPKLSVAAHRELGRVITERQSQLRLHAQLRGERLLADGCGGLCRRIDTYWRIASAMKRS